MRRSFVSLALAASLLGACGVQHTIRRELGDTPQEQIQKVQADRARCQP